jgi:hypothetical protein
MKRHNLQDDNDTAFSNINIPLKAIGRLLLETNQSAVAAALHDLCTKKLRSHKITIENTKPDFLTEERIQQNSNIQNNKAGGLTRTNSEYRRPCF